VRGLSRAVTITVLLLVGGGGAWFIASRVMRSPVGQGFHTFAMFRDGSGLPIGSQVLIAGVQVGEIDGLSIEHGLARVSLRLRNDVAIWNDAWAAKRASSLLGDSYIEILPGGAGEDGTVEPNLRRLANGEQIPHVLEAGATERVLRDIRNAMPRVDSAMTAADKALIEARRTVSGPVADAFEYADRWLEAGAIAGPINSAASAARAMNDWTVGAADGTLGLAARVNPVLDDVLAGIDGASASLASAQVTIRDSMSTTRTRMDDIDPYLDRASAAIAEYTGAAPGEQGTLAKLITDGDLGDRLDDVTTGIKGSTDGLSQAISWLGIRVELNVLSRAPRLYVIAEINARDDKFYLVELEKGGLGGIPNTTLTDQVGSDVWTLRSGIEERIRFTAQFGKRFGPARVRFGFKDSTIGAGGDLNLFNRRLKLSADVFDATFARAPRVKLAASVEIFKFIYLLAGVDDALNPGGYLPIAPWPAAQDVPQYFEQVRYGRDYFVGGMLNITDADLAVMLRVYGALLLSGLVK